jgi:peptide/nickel transport system permease protein
VVPSAVGRSIGFLDAGARGRRAPALGLLRQPLVRVVVRRLLQAVPLLLVVSALAFILVSITSDPARQILGLQAPPDAYIRLRHQLGLDKPLYAQYWHWLSHAVRGDLGTSVIAPYANVTTTIQVRFPVTLSLTVASLIVIGIVGVGLGVASAVYGGALAKFIDALALVGFALPGFWVGAALISLFAVKLHWLPAIGYVSLGQSPVDWARSIVLPVSALALSGVAGLAKQTREAMLDVLASEHVRMAWASGISPRTVYFRLALKNAGIRSLTILGLTAVGLISGTVFVETVFALPGLGSLLADSTQRGDLPTVLGITVFFTLVIVLINLVVDLLYALLDPRVRTS